MTLHACSYETEVKILRRSCIKIWVQNKTYNVYMITPQAHLQNKTEQNQRLASPFEMKLHATLDASYKDIIYLSYSFSVSDKSMQLKSLTIWVQSSKCKMLKTAILVICISLTSQFI